MAAGLLNHLQLLFSCWLAEACCLFIVWFLLAVLFVRLHVSMLWMGSGAAAHAVLPLLMTAPLLHVACSCMRLDGHSVLRVCSSLLHSIAHWCIASHPGGECWHATHGIAAAGTCACGSGMRCCCCACTTGDNGTAWIWCSTKAECGEPCRGVLQLHAVVHRGVCRDSA